jgi:hypothetical protein
VVAGLGFGSHRGRDNLRDAVCTNGSHPIHHITRRDVSPSFDPDKRMSRNEPQAWSSTPTTST